MWHTVPNHKIHNFTKGNNAMATELESLVAQAGEVQRRLEAQGATEDAAVVARLVRELTAAKPKAERPYYTVSEAAALIGVSGQTVKNWISRGLLDGYRLGGRIVIPRAILDSYRPLADALKALDPTPPTDEILRHINAGRRPFTWPGGLEEPEA
jgi:excisionase family DNA binding protein